MSKNLRHTQTVDAGKNLAYKISYVLLDDGIGSEVCIHNNFAEGVGQALFAFHQWIQHNMNTQPYEYRILSLHRILRTLQNGEYVFAGEVEMELFNKDKPNPLVQSAIPRSTEDGTTPFDFLAEVPIVSTLKK